LVVVLYILALKNKQNKKKNRKEKKREDHFVATQVIAMLNSRLSGSNLKKIHS
jgi:hypothetical protein